MGVVNRFQVAYDGLQADLDGFPDALKNLTTGEINQLENIGTVTVSAGQWGYIGNLDQDLITSSTVTFATISVNNAGLKMKDSDASHDLIFDTDSNLTLDRTLKFDTGDADRTLTINGNVTLNDWFDQSVKTTASPTFVTPIITSGINFNSGSGAIQDSGTDAITFDGSQNVTIPNGDLTINSVGSGAAAILNLNGTADGSMNWISDSLYSGLSTTNSVIHLFGKAHSTNDSGYVGYKYSGVGSTSNKLIFGLYANDSILEIEGTGNVIIPTGDLVIATSSTPASASATGTTGTIAWNSTHFFVCIAPDTWVRAALSTWA